MKKLLTILLTLALAMSLAVPVFAAPEDTDGPASEAEEIETVSDYARGWDDGYDAGYAAGCEKGRADQAAGAPWADQDYPGDDLWEGETYQEGYDMGYAYGLLSGYSDGYMEQYFAGYEAGYDETYDQGFAAGQADGKAGTPADPWDDVSELGPEEDFSYECGVNDGRCYGYTEGYEAGYFDVTGRSYEEDMAIAATGGVPGQVNVMFNGEMVRFPDQRPVLKDGRTMVPVRAVMESMGAQVDYDASLKAVIIILNGATTTFTVGSSAYSVTKDGEVTRGTMDCACYNLNGRVMVPIRFLAEASGYTVCWDGHRHTAVIVDTEGLAAKIDENFTYINSIMAARLTENQGKKQETVTTFNVKNTLYDEDGQAVTFPISGEVTTHTDGTAWRIKMSISIKDALQTMLNNDMGLLADATISLRTAMRTDLNNLTAAIILDKEGNLYFQAPVILELLGSEPMEDNQWISLGNVGQYGVGMEDLSDGTMTVGSLLVTSLVRDETAFDLEETLDIAVPLLEAIYGDDVAEKNGDGYTWKFDLVSILLTTGLVELTAEDLAEDLGDNNLTATLTADVKGNYSLTGDWRFGTEEAALTGSLNNSGTATSGKMSFTLALTDLFELELTSESTTRIVRDLPALELPADAEVLETGDELSWDALAE